MEFTSFSFEYDDPIHNAREYGPNFRQCSIEKLEELNRSFRNFFNAIQDRQSRSYIKLKYKKFLTIFKQCNCGCYYRHYNQRCASEYDSLSYTIRECMERSCKILRSDKIKLMDLSNDEREKLAKIIEKERQIIEDDFR